MSFQAPDLIPFDNPHHKDNAIEEGEGYGSRIYSTYDGLHKKTSDVFQVIFRDCRRARIKFIDISQCFVH